MTSKVYFLRADTCEILDPQRFESFSLNGVAVEIIKKICDGVAVSGVAQALASKHNLPIEQVEQDVLDLLDDLRRYGVDPRNIRHLDQNNFWLHRRALISTPIIHVIQNCNSPCVACDCWKTQGIVQLRFEELVDTIDEFAKQGAAAIMVSGGEPLLRRDLAKIIRHIKNRGLRVELNTNGYLLHKRPELSDLGVDSLVVSIDGVDSATYLRLRGKDWFDTVRQNLAEFQIRSPETSLGLRATLTSYLLGKLERVFGLATEWNAASVGFSPLDVDSDSFKRNMTADRKRSLIDALMPEPRLLEAFLGKAGESDRRVLSDMHKLGKSTWNGQVYDQCIKHYLKIMGREVSAPLLEGTGPCRFPYTSSLVDYDGSIRPCFYADPIGTIHDLPEVDWSAKGALQRLIQDGTCINCRGKVFCR